MKISLLTVGGNGCANCVSVDAVVSRLAQERGIAFERIELDGRTREEVARLQIERVPAILIMRDGEPIARCYGYQPEEILEVWLDAKLTQEGIR